MCGVFGVLGAPVDMAIEKFEKLALLSQRRGQDSFGAFAVSTGFDQVSVFKEIGSVRSSLRSKLYRSFKNIIGECPEAVGLIGHTRLATNGDCSNNDNNQPALYGDWVVVHNGIVTNEAALKAQYLSSDFGKELDTFGFLGLLEHCFSGAREVDVHDVIRIIHSSVKGANNFVFYSPRINKVIFISSNGSLFLAMGPDREWYFSSEKFFLQDGLQINENEIQQLSANRSAVWDLDSGQMSLLDDRSGPFLVHVDSVSTKRYQFIQKSLCSDKGASKDIYNLSKIMIHEHEMVSKQVKALKRCTKCLLPASFPGIVVRQDGCSVCDAYVRQNVTTDLEALDRALGPRANPVLLSLSGGRDSSYTAHVVAKELKRKVIAFTYDWGMVTDLARRNQARICGELGIEHVIVAADIQYKRNNIRKNIKAWMRRPSLGTIPLFMAGDKHYFYYAKKIAQELGCSHIVMGENKLEKTGFKTKFAGADQEGKQSSMAYNLSSQGKIKMLAYYGKEFALNHGYWNASLVDTLKGFLSYYMIPHDYVNLFDFVNWEESLVDDVLKAYDWELSSDCATTWRIGDGTAPFYNYIYYTVAGFSENDTLRANQLREGQITIDQAKKLIDRDNYPRAESFAWYCNALNLDPVEIVNAIGRIPKRFELL